jgi:hypothetical protein
MNHVQQILAGVDPARAAPARIYDYLLGRTANFQSDRDAAVVHFVPGESDPRPCWHVTWRLLRQAATCPCRT